MKIAIHSHKDSFSERWIEYCITHNIDYKIVNCLDTDIISQLKDRDALMWHHQGTDYKDVLAAKNILFSLEHAGVKVFPDFKSNWHFDDKIAQMYLLQAIDAPLVPSYVFYDKVSAINWVLHTNFPKVFKLRKGDGSRNVKLVKNKKDAQKLIITAFGKGFSQFNRYDNLRELFRKYKQGKNKLLDVLNGVRRVFFPTSFSRMASREKGYAYFQDFIPNNNTDTRIIIVGNRAFALTRGVRKNDFRASGSGDINYDKDIINLEALRISFDINKKIKSQSIAFDFVILDNKPLIVEISYGYAVEAYDLCPGYWDEDLEWNEGKFNPQEWMVEDLIKSHSTNN